MKQVRNQVWKVGKQVANQVDAMTQGSQRHAWWQVDDQVWRQVWDQVDNEVGNQIREQAVPWLSIRERIPGLGSGRDVRDQGSDLKPGDEK